MSLLAVDGPKQSLFSPPQPAVAFSNYEVGGALAFSNYEVGGSLASSGGSSSGSSGGGTICVA